jgi:hypothetical protein
LVICKKKKKMKKKMKKKSEEWLLFFPVMRLLTNSVCFLPIVPEPLSLAPLTYYPTITITIIIIIMMRASLENISCSSSTFFNSLFLTNIYIFSFFKIVQGDPVSSKPLFFKKYISLMWRITRNNFVMFLSIHWFL